MNVSSGVVSTCVTATLWEDRSKIHAISVCMSSHNIRAVKNTMYKLGVKN